MIITITLNKNDIIKMISEKYGVDEKKIKMETIGASDDGPYHQAAGVWFSFDKNE